MDVLFNITTILIFGLFFGNLVKHFKLPNVIGYLLAGIVIGPFALNLVEVGDLKALDVLSTIALGIISFLIGAELKIKNIKKIGAKPFIISIIISLTTFLVVVTGIYLVSKSFSMALILGSIASATAPPTVLMVLKQYKAKGKLTNHILSVMAIDDIVSIILFGFCLMVAKNMNSEVVNLAQLLEPLKEIVLSLVIGVGSGLIIGTISKRLAKSTDIVIVALLSIFVPLIICNYFELSPFLTCVIAGFIYVNLFKGRSTHKLIDTIDYISPPILLMFFVMSGISIDFKLIPVIGILGLCYIILRIIGKVIGAYMGGSLVKSDVKISRSLGCCLFPQTGVAIGLATATLIVLPNEGEIIVAIVIISSFVFDFISPFILKNRLKAFKEIK